MNFSSWLMLTPAGMMAFLLLAALYRRIYVVGDRSAEDAVPVLTPLGAMGVHDLFSPVAETYLRMNLTPQQFRIAQRQRVLLALEYTRRIAQNALVLQQWARHELARARALKITDCSRLSMDLIAASVPCRMWALLLRARLYCCLMFITLLPFVSPPNFDRLIRFGRVNLLEFYSTMRSAARALGTYFEEGQGKRMAELL